VDGSTTTSFEQSSHGMFYGTQVIEKNASAGYGSVATGERTVEHVVVGTSSYVTASGTSKDSAVAHEPSISGLEATDVMQIESHTWAVDPEKPSLLLQPVQTVSESNNFQPTSGGSVAVTAKTERHIRSIQQEHTKTWHIKQAADAPPADAAAAQAASGVPSASAANAAQAVPAFAGAAAAAAAGATVVSIEGAVAQPHAGDTPAESGLPQRSPDKMTSLQHTSGADVTTTETTVKNVNQLLGVDRTVTTVMEHAAFEETAHITSGSGEKAVLGKTQRTNAPTIRGVRKVETVSGGVFTNNHVEETIEYSGVKESDGSTKIQQEKPIGTTTKQTLTPLSERALGSVAGAATTMVLERLIDGKKITGKAVGKAVVSAAEAGALAAIGTLADATSNAGGALAAAGGVVAAAFALKELMHEPAEGAPKRDAGDVALDGGCAVATAAVQVVAAATRCTAAGIIVSGAGLAVDVVKNGADYVRGRKTFAQASAGALQAATTLGVGTAASVATTAVLGCAGVVAGTGLAAAATLAIVPAIAFSAAVYGFTKLISFVTGWWGRRQRRKEMTALCAKIGVTEDDSDEVVRRAYFKRTLQAHPDRPGGSNAAFQQLTKDLARLMELRIEFKKSVAVEKRGQRRVPSMASFFMGMLAAFIDNVRAWSPEQAEEISRPDAPLLLTWQEKHMEAEAGP
jgi:hypothetical protein